jgi:hypothetical protein
MTRDSIPHAESTPDNSSTTHRPARTRPEELPHRGSRSPDQSVAREVTSRGENASISTAWPAADEGVALTHPGAGSPFAREFQARRAPMRAVSSPGPLVPAPGRTDSSGDDHAVCGGEHARGERDRSGGGEGVRPRPRARLADGHVGNIPPDCASTPSASRMHATQRATSPNSVPLSTARVASVITSSTPACACPARK